MKLEEAEFFLTKLRKHYYDDIRNLLKGGSRRSVFRFYLSAYVSAARSVTWVMRAEYSRQSGWEAWFEGQRPAPGDEELLKVFNDLRIQSEKTTPLLPGHSFEFADETTLPRQSKGRQQRRRGRLPRFTITIRPTNEPEGPILYHAEVRSVGRTLDALDGKDLLSTCERYTKILRDLVSDCEDLFGSADG